MLLGAKISNKRLFFPTCFLLLETETLNCVVKLREFRRAKPRIKTELFPGEGISCDICTLFKTVICTLIGTSHNKILNLVV